MPTCRTAAVGRRAKLAFVIVHMVELFLLFPMGGWFRVKNTLYLDFFAHAEEAFLCRDFSQPPMLRQGASDTSTPAAVRSFRCVLTRFASYRTVLVRCRWERVRLSSRALPRRIRAAPCKAPVDAGTWHPRSSSLHFAVVHEAAFGLFSFGGRLSPWCVMRRTLKERALQHVRLFSVALMSLDRYSNAHTPCVATRKLL